MDREIFPLLIIALIFAIAWYAEPKVITNDRGEIISHWNALGQPNGWMDKTAIIYLIPVLSLILYLAMLLIPKIDVYPQNLKEFEQQFWGFRVILVFVMGVIYVATLIPNLGYWGSTDPLLIIIPAVALLFFYVGYMLNFTKRNYFIGIRTPWTLADEEVWEKTNRLGGRLFWICGALTLVSLVTPGDLRIWMIVAPAILFAIGLMIYSYFEYRKVKEAHGSRAEEEPPVADMEGRDWAKVERKAAKRKKGRK